MPDVSVNNVAGVGRGVYVSNFQHCDQHGGEYDLVIHVYRDSQTPDVRCAVVREQLARGGLMVRYSEGEPLGSMSVPLADVFAYAGRPGKLLVHCQYGIYRAPMLALVALVARGATPAEAIGGLLTGQWRDRGVAFYLASLPVCELIAFAESRAGSPAAGA